MFKESDQYKELNRELLIKLRNYLMSNDPLFSNVKEETVLHSGGQIHLHEKNEKVFRFESINAELTIQTDDIINYNLENISYSILSTILELINEQRKLFIANLNDVAEYHENVVSANGQILTIDLLIEIMNNMELEFDDHGNVKNNFQIIIAPELYQKEFMDFGDKEKKRFDEFIEKKKYEYFSKKRYRKLSYID